MLSNYRLLFACALLTAPVLLLTGCGPTPTKPEQTPVIKPVEPELSADQKQLEDYKQRFQSILGQAAEYRANPLTRLAIEVSNTIEPRSNQSGNQTGELSSSPASSSLRLQQQILLGDILDAIDPLKITSKLLADYRLINAHQLAALGEQQWALDFLTEPFFSANYTQLLAPRLTRAYQLRAKLYSQLKLPGSAINAAQDYLVLTTLLGNSDELANNELQLLAVLNGLTSAEIDQALNQDSGQVQLPPQLLNTLAFLKQVKSTRSPQQLSYLADNWQRSYMLPLSDQLVNDYLKQRQSFFYQPTNIAVLLPLTGSLAKPGTTVQQGILAAYYADTAAHPELESLSLRFYDTEGKTENIWLDYQQAVDDGADIIIGPLNKQSVESLSRSEALSLPTLALNQSPLNAKQLFTFSLSPEQEAQQAALHAWQAGHRHAAILVPQGNWGERLRDAFSLHWQTLGGTVVESQSYDAKQHDFSDSIKMLLNVDDSLNRRSEITRILGQSLNFTPRRRQDVDMIFMGAFARQARQIPSQLQFHHGEGIPVYATSHVASNEWDANTLRDLEGVHFPDMPWLLGMQEQSISAQNQESSISYKRLFSFGVDAYQLLPMLKLLAENPGEPFAGETGVLSVDSQGQIQRKLPWVWVKRGRLRADTDIDS